MMTKEYKQLKTAYESLVDDFHVLERTVKKLYANCLTIDDAKKRDYIVRTKYIGKVKDDKLLKDFKNEITITLGDTFDNICNNILHYRLIDLQRYRDILNNYELKQIVLDVYGNKKSEK